jgi:hypothetical protein
VGEWMGIAIHTDSEEQRSPIMRRLLASYLGQAMLSPFHYVVLGALASACVLAHSVAPVLLGVPVAEALVLVALPRWSRFRRHVDDANDARMKAEHQQRRTSLMNRMSQRHREVVNELERLETSLAERIPIDAMSSFADLRVDRLIDGYVQLAVAHDEARSIVDRMPIDEVGDAVTGRTRLADVSALRRQSRAANTAKLARLVEQMQTIEEAVKLLHERLLFTIDPDEIGKITNVFVEEIERTRPVVDALLASSTSLDESGPTNLIDCPRATARRLLNSR